ncbi:hypothetical protein HXX01_02495 [Candidatus Nomurabacteria bacterium]|nr:hypothetical protein [Candidatus Nomurabacteria bacterium]
MKKIGFLFSVVISLTIFESYSQTLIAVQNGGTTSFYQQVDDAILNSQDGDTIYIPGGTWSLSRLINKRLHIVGVGYHPDSTNATFPTKLMGHLFLAAGSSEGSCTGLFLDGAIYDDYDPVELYKIERCYISGGVQVNQQNSQFTFIENYISGNIYCGSGSASHFSFFNSVIAAFTLNSRPFTNSVFRNNIFLSASSCDWGNCHYVIACSFSLFENNIFYNTWQYNALLAAVSNSIFKNNLFVDNNPFPNGSLNVGSNNLISQAQNCIIVNYTGIHYSSDYHLQPTCPGKNAGTDGTDIGIYGGVYPWKDGGVPFNPHIQHIVTSPQTDSSGNLNVDIKVAAQDR